MSDVPRKPTVPEVLPLVQALYSRSSVGCCLHVVLDDGNVEDVFVRHCLEFARQEGCGECERLAGLLTQMSRTQRTKLYRSLG